MTTMKEISQIAGVSISTVSLVLNNRDSGRIKPAIAEKIRKDCQRSRLLSNLMARGLRTKPNAYFRLPQRRGSKPHPMQVL